MSQYNLITVGLFTSTTTSGTGNKVLTSEELLLLYDGNTTSSGIDLTTSDVLYLDVDIGYRIVMESVKLFIDVPGDRNEALMSVDFYYKNNESDLFILCSKNQDNDTFYQVKPFDVFAPRYIRVVINSVQATIYELQILNDDTQVSFGSTGIETSVFLNSSEDESTSLAIYNNSAIGTAPVNAYVSIDYRGLPSDYYVKLATSKDGTYYGIEDGFTIKDNDLSSSVTWNKGTFENVEVISTTECLTTLSYITGYYTTPVIKLDDLFDATFILSNVSLKSDAKITYNPTTVNGTIKIRSSNTEPAPFSKIFWMYKNENNNIMIFEGDMLTGNELPEKQSICNNTSSIPQKVIFDKFNSHFITIEETSTYPNNTYIIRKFDYITGQQLYESQASYVNNIAENVGVDIDGHIWGYSRAIDNTLIVYNTDLTTYTTVVNGGESPFISDMSVDKQLPSCWYASELNNKIVHVQYDGVTLASVSIIHPTYICSISNGGCIVVSNDKSVVTQYSAYGTLIAEFEYTGFATIMGISYGFNSVNVDYDISEFWMLLSGGKVIKLSFSGDTITTAIITSAVSIEAFPGGCLVFGSNSKVYQLNNDGKISRIWDFNKYVTKGLNAVPVVINYTEFLLMPDVEHIIPTIYDPIWGEEAAWNEVALSGYKLPMKTYHQIKYQFLPEVVEISIENPKAELGISGWINNGVDTFEISTVEVWEGTCSFKIHLQDAGAELYQLVELTTVSGVDMEKVDLEYYYINMTAMAMLYNASDNNYVSVTVEFYDWDMRLINSNESERVYTNTWVEIKLDVLVLIGTRFIKLKISPYTTSYSYAYYDLISSHMYIKPVLKSIIIPKPIEVQDLQPQEYKNIYIKTEFPEDAPFQEYETVLKCWWGNESKSEGIDSVPFQSFLSRNDGVSLSSVKSIIFDIKDAWLNSIMGITSIEFMDANGDIIDINNIGFTVYSSHHNDSLAIHAFDNTLSKVGPSGYTSWFINKGTYQRLICVVDTPISIFGIIINNFHNSGSLTSYGVKNINIYISSSGEVLEDSCFYGAPFANTMLVFDGQIRKHVEDNVVDDQILTLR